jgi:hypothetical protein
VAGPLRRANRPPARKEIATRILPSAYRDRTQHFVNLNDHRPGQRASRVGDVWRIDRDIYDYFLEILPPLDWRGSSFLVSEALAEDVHSAYFECDGSLYCGFVRRANAHEQIRTMCAFVRDG